MRFLVIATTVAIVALLGEGLGTTGWEFVTLGLVVVAAGALALEAISRYR